MITMFFGSEPEIFSVIARQRHFLVPTEQRTLAGYYYQIYAQILDRSTAIGQEHQNLKYCRLKYYVEGYTSGQGKGFEGELQEVALRRLGHMKYNLSIQIHVGECQAL